MDSIDRIEVDWGILSKRRHSAAAAASRARARCQRAIWARLGLSLGGAGSRGPFERLPEALGRPEVARTLAKSRPIKTRAPQSYQNKLDRLERQRAPRLEAGMRAASLGRGIKAGRACRRAASSASRPGKVITLGVELPPDKSEKEARERLPRIQPIITTGGHTKRREARRHARLA